MNPHQALSGAVIAALRAHGPLAVALNGVFDAAPRRALRPYALVEDPVLTDWSTKDQAGREARLAIQLRTIGERRAGLRALAEQVEVALEAIDPALGGGWWCVSLVLMRSRILADGDDRLTALIEFRARMLRGQ